MRFLALVKLVQHVDVSENYEKLESHSPLPTFLQKRNIFIDSRDFFNLQTLYTLIAQRFWITPFRNDFVVLEQHH